MMKLFIFADALVVGFTAGHFDEARTIQQTCEDDNGHTVLNGTEYLCLSQRQIEIMKANRQRGA